MGNVVDLQAWNKQRGANTEAREAAYNASEAQKVAKKEFTGEEQQRIKDLIYGPESNGLNEATDSVENADELVETTPQGTPRLYDAKGEYILNYDPTNEDALNAKKELTEMGCRLSDLDHVTHADELFDKLISLGKPAEAATSLTEEAKSGEINPNEAFIVTRKVTETEPLEINTISSSFRIVSGQPSETGYKVQFLSSEGGVMVGEQMLQPGENLIYRANEPKIIITLSGVSEAGVPANGGDSATLEISQVGGSIKELNSPYKMAA